MKRLLVILAIITLCFGTPVFATSWHWVTSADETDYSFDTDELIVGTDSQGRRYAVVWIRQTYPEGKTIGDWTVYDRISRECLYLKDRTMATVDNYLIDGDGKIVRRFSVPYHQRVEILVEKKDPIYQVWQALNNYWVDKKYKNVRL